MGNTDQVMGTNIDFGGLYQLIGALVEKRTSDPSSPVIGQIWCRTDTSPPKYKWYDGTTAQVLADLNSVVNTLAAGDSTITVGGTATARTVIVAKTLDHTYITDFDTQVRTSRLDQMAAPTADVSMNNHKITNLTDPSGAQDAVNLRTVQSMVSGLSDRAECIYATAAALPTNTYANGTAGVGATLTATANGVLNVDGTPVLLGDRVLVTSEATAANNGIYTVTTLGTVSVKYVLTRATDFDEAAEAVTGALIPVKAPPGRTAGTANDNKVFISSVATPATIGTTGIAFSLIGSTYSAGTGLTLTGTTFSLTIPVAISSGGTNATTATGARQSLVVPTEVPFTIGDGVATSFVCTHSLNDSTVSTRIIRLSDGAAIGHGSLRTSANAVTVYIGTSTSPIGSNTHKVFVGGVEGIG